MVDIQSATAEIRRGKKEERKKNKRQDENILWPALLHRAAIKKYCSIGSNAEYENIAIPFVILFAIIF